MILVSHPTGNRNLRAVVEGLIKAGLLGRFVTSIAVKEGGWLVNRFPSSVRHELLRRRFDIPDYLLATYPWMELGRLAAKKGRIDALTRQEIGLFSADAIYRYIDRRVASSLLKLAVARQLSGVYCYEDGALQSFQAARQLGLRRIYDLPIAYWETARRLMEEELERLPEWKTTMEAMKDSASKLQRKTEELELAETVICPSKFVYDSLPQSTKESKQCVVAPFGSPPERKSGRRERPEGKGKLRILFAGSMSQRKGLADVFAAMKIAKRPDVELVVFGSPVAPMSFYRSQFSDFVYEPPRPHEAVLELMETCDALALPSIVEGRALVQQEALCCGLPLIITANTGGEDLVEEGSTGFLVPIRSPDAIAEKIHWFADHRKELESMRIQARDKARSLTWTGYSDAIIEAITLQKRKNQPLEKL